MSLGGKLGLLVLVGAAAALWATKPSETEVEEQLAAVVKTRIVNQKIDANDPVGAIFGIGCRFGLDECYRLVRQGMTVDYRDRWLFATVSIEMREGERLECYGALGQLYCPRLPGEA
jgi:hypothetical protein